MNSGAIRIRSLIGLAFTLYPCVQALTAALPSDATACNDHRPQLLEALHAAQQQLAAVENQTIATPYYSGPAFAYRLLSFNQWKQATEARLQARIAAINAEGQREANCVAEKEAKRKEMKKERAYKALVSSARRGSSNPDPWHHVASHDLVFFKHKVVTIRGKYFPSSGGTTVSFLMNPTLSYIDPATALHIEGDDSPAINQQNVDECRTRVATDKPFCMVTFVGEIRQCVASQDFSSPEAQQLSDREWGRWLCLSVTSLGVDQTTPDLVPGTAAQRPLDNIIDNAR